MNEKNSIRVLWLLNHTTLRAFEIPQLRLLGLTEIFTPKIIPDGTGVFSASVNNFYDECLTIPKSELEILNAQNWYEEPSDEAWRIVNRYFDIAIIGCFPKQITALATNFNGVIVMRAFGLGVGLTYTSIFEHEIGFQGMEKVQALGTRFWFATAYEHLHEIEAEWLQKRACYLPIGLNSVNVKIDWEGTLKSIFFVCPRINVSDYYKNIYLQFIQDFSEFQFSIAGAQDVEVDDERVLGFLSKEEYLENMRKHRVMFYHSQEPNHVHYHPFEAIKIGLPLIFMAGGLLDKIGGLGLWGRCNTVEEAKTKVRQIFADDGELIRNIQQEQVQLLKCMDPEYCQGYFRLAFQKFMQGLQIASKTQCNQLSVKKLTKRAAKKIAVIIPIPYRGGSLRGTIVLINSLINGANASNEHVDIVLAHLDVDGYSDSVFRDLHPTVQRRPYTWKTLSRREATRAMSYAGQLELQLDSKEYYIPDDGINQFFDCDLWVVISDRLEKTLLPIRPHILMVYDYIQRYVPIINQDLNQKLMSNAHHALSVMTTTEFTQKDALQFMGLASDKVLKMPMLVPDFKLQETDRAGLQSSNYFIWTTNPARHKNHYITFEALQIYYDEFGGSLECHITGPITDQLFYHHPKLEKNIAQSPRLKANIKICNELSDFYYKQKLKNAAFLLHTATVDNGTFSVVEAAQIGIPSLSSDYPPMREMDALFNLELNWMDSTSAEDIAKNLKIMEEKYLRLKEKLLVKDVQQFKHTHDDEVYYWKVIKSCL